MRYSYIPIHQSATSGLTHPNSPANSFTKFTPQRTAEESTLPHSFFPNEKSTQIFALISKNSHSSIMTNEARFKSLQNRIVKNRGMSHSNQYQILPQTFIPFQQSLTSAVNDSRSTTKY